MAPGVHVVLEVVRMAMNEQFLTLMPTLYPGSMATDPKPYASLDAMWKALSDLAYKMTPAVNGENNFICLFLRRERGHPRRRGPGPPVMGAVRAECRPSCFYGRRDRVIIQLLYSSMVPLTLGLTTTSNCWPLEEHHYAEVLVVCASFKTDDPPLWSDLLSPSARAAALRANRGDCLNCREDTHTLSTV